MLPCAALRPRAEKRVPPRRLQRHLGKACRDLLLGVRVHASILRASSARANPFLVTPRRGPLRLPFVALALLLLIAGAPRAVAEEEQAHGLVFERWVRDTFFQGYRPDGYTQKWDVPGELNRLSDPALAGLPVNPKATKFRSPVGLGDALRQHDIEEPFILVLGYWTQASPDEKRLVKILALRVEPATWRALWGPVTRADLERLDAVVKDRSVSAAEARRRAQTMKSRPPFSEAVFVLNPKIDEKGQRRLQCSLRYEDVLARLAPEATPGPDETPALWGKPFPAAIASAPRKSAAPASVSD